MTIRQCHRGLTFYRRKDSGCNDYAGPREPHLLGIGKGMIFLAFLWA